MISLDQIRNLNVSAFFPINQLKILNPTKVEFLQKLGSHGSFIRPSTIQGM